MLNEKKENLNANEKKSIAKIKHIQYTDQGDYILGTDNMAITVGNIYKEGYKLENIFNIGKDGIILEIKPVNIEDPDVMFWVQNLFINQISLRGIVDNQSLSRILASGT